MIAVLMLVQVACAIFSSTASTDTNRDIYFAQQIASAREFPLLGPQINGMLHMGPVWFYVLAPAAWLVPNAAAVTACMAFIGALQFPLAYCLGTHFGSPREGLLFVLALAAPGFMAVSLVSLTHTIAVIPSLLLGVFAAMAYRARPDWKRASWLGVVSALALNAHPTTLPVLAALLLWSAIGARGLRHVFLHAAIVAAVVALSFAPMLYAQWRDGFADAATTAQYVHATLALPSLSKGLFLVYAILDYGPKYMARFWLDMPAVGARWLMAVWAGVVVAAGFGLVARFLREPRARRLIALLLGILVLQSIFVCAIRTDMPPWMIYAQWPLIAALLALGLDWICRKGRYGRAAVAAALIVTTAWSFAIWTHMAMGGSDFVEMKPAPGKMPLMADIREYDNDREFLRMPRMPFRQIFAIGSPLCEPATLFGHYAYFVDISYGIGALQACGDRGNIRLGGPVEPGRNAMFGLRDLAWQRLGMKPARWIGVLGLGTPTAVWHSTVPLRPETPHLSTLPHRISAVAKRFRIDGEAAPDQAVLVAHRTNRYVPFSIIGATANGIEIEPVYEDAMTAAYRLPAGFAADEVHWRFEIEGAADYVDALTFASGD